jgi:hypothetical protein
MAGRPPASTVVAGLASDSQHSRNVACILRVKGMPARISPRSNGGGPSASRSSTGSARGLFEVWTSWNGNICRVLFCFTGTTIVLLHGFPKKSQKTPKADLDLARRRMKCTDLP